MIHYEKENEDVVKYEVTINRTELEKIKGELKENCIEVTHVVRNSAIDPAPLPGQTIKNLQKKFLCKFSLGVGVDKDVYQYSYDSHMEPQLVAIIDCLLEGNPNVIQELKQGNQESTRKEMNLSPYYSKVLGCITMTEVRRMPIKETKKLMEFFLGELNPESQEFKNLAQILPEESEESVQDKNSQKEKRL